MALLDTLRSWLGMDSRFDNVTFYTPSISHVMGMGPEELYRTQPHLRTVISFLARNIAQLPLPVYQRVSDTDRRRVFDDPLAMLLKRPNPGQTTFELITQTVSDYKLYDYAVWAIAETPDTDSGWLLRVVPPSWIVATGGGTPWEPSWLRVTNPGSGKVTILTDGDFIAFHGYRPGAPGKGASPVDALREILAEQIQAWSYRQQIWQKGGRVGTYITRPADAPDWSPEARTKFQRDWAAKWTGPNGPKAGGTPLFEDGMELKRLAFSAREEEWSEVAKLSLATVAAVYHTSPTMVGILDNANFSNVKEFARMLYTDTLGPDLAMFEQRINTFLVPRVAKSDDLYAEFNIAVKMAGSFEEQAAVISTSVGRPWMTADEARARFNMPALGGDAARLVTPLNVLVGGQASPRDAGSQNRNGAVPSAKGRGPVLAVPEKVGEEVRVKAEPRDEDAVLAAEVLRRFFKRQRAVVLSRLGAKADADWWDEDRWNGELADDLYALAMQVSKEVAESTLRLLDVEPDVYSPERTMKFLRAVAESRSGAINAKTREQIEAALSGDLSDDAEKSTPAGVFDEAESSRSEQSGLTLATTLAAFAVTEAGKQLGRPGVTKTWLTTSANPRPSHAVMDGETVGIDETYSNGMSWPGDPLGGADEVANCSCISELTIP